MATPRPLSGIAGASLAALLLLTSCADSAPDESPDRSAGETPSNPADEGARAPEPSGDQVSHDDMRAAVESQLTGATLTDTDDYWGDLRSIETELQKLQVDPVDCKQYVVESATPVPDGALLVHADTASGSDDGDGSGGDGENGGGGSDGDGGGTPGEEPTGSPQSPNESGSPEAGGAFAGTSGAVAGFSSQVAAPMQAEQTSEAPSETPSASPSESSSASPSPSESSSGSPSPSESPSGSPSNSAGDGTDTPGLSEDRQVTLYSYADWRAAEAHLAGEQDGMETCSTYTATRDGGEDTDEIESTTTVEPVTLELEEDDSDDASDDGSSDGPDGEAGPSVDEAVAMTREVEIDGETQRALGLLVRQGSLVLSISAPAESELGERQAESAAEGLLSQAEAILAELDG